ncbi:MAG: DUF1080 domain-containing protein [Candidatus Hydrogenedentes bacterium]|nr:DUF1080 domain-containing protein [Candidatus Hydrogenedentota bacterium]
MRTALSVFAILALAGTVLAEAPEGFTSLFDGKSIEGWSGAPGLWSVQEGLIVGKTTADAPLKHNSFLIYPTEYKDFVLSIKVKLINHNSGIQFRSEMLDDFAVKGYQADVAEQTYFGMLYEEQGRGIMEYWKKMSEKEQQAVFGAAKLDDWNEYEITCQGDHVQMKLNGVVTCDIVDPDGADSGIIALQLHAGPPMEVQFKDIFVKEL